MQAQLPALLFVVLLVAGAAASAVIELLRVLPGLSALVQRGVKPLACDLCMSFWVGGSLGALLGWLASGEVRWQALLGCALAGFGGTRAALAWLSSLEPPPPSDLLD